jgi:hypothetical protein
VDYNNPTGYLKVLGSGVCINELHPFPRHTTQDLYNILFPRLKYSVLQGSSLNREVSNNQKKKKQKKTKNQKTDPGSP